MAIETDGYVVLRADGVTETKISKGEIDSSQMSIPLLGQNATPYGDSAAQAWIQHLENFASGTAPINAIPGQLWFNKDTNEVSVNIAEGDESQGFNATWSTFLTSDKTNPDDDLGSAGDPWADVIYARHFFATGGGKHGDEGPDADGADGQFVGTATQAKYADLAERFASDKVYDEGTVVKLGGTKEVTVATEEGDFDVLGVVSIKPAFMMNAQAGNNDTHPYIALQGRVPVKVEGTVKKGDRIIAGSEPGTARAVKADDLGDISPFQVIGRALEAKRTKKIDLLMVVVGAK